MKKLLELFDLTLPAIKVKSKQTNRRHVEFRNHFENVLNGAAIDDELVSSYLSHRPSKSLDFYLNNILYKKDHNNIETKLTQEMITLTSYYAHWLLENFEPNPVKTFFLDNVFHVNYENLSTFSLNSSSSYYDEHIAISLCVLQAVFNHLPISEQLMLEYVNETYELRLERHQNNMLLDIADYIVGMYYEHTLNFDTQSMQNFHEAITHPDIMALSEKKILNLKVHTTENKKGFKL